jgi:hypothetical protein
MTTLLLVSMKIQYTIILSVKGKPRGAGSLQSDCKLTYVKLKRTIPLNE